MFGLFVLSDLRNIVINRALTASPLSKTKLVLEKIIFVLLSNFRSMLPFNFAIIMLPVLFLAILNGHSGLAVRSQFRGRRAPGSKPDSSEDPPCMAPITPKCPSVGVVCTLGADHGSN
ncbi:hypothetical protein AVEN_268530-1 [Araneus ventricosus]|uniref:Uncharacterized protein n=1 Tax=Araneus ventricosus TaxID=182803 RepID=A0A4Y2I5R8_ARAVE|nr:hypothetical protein AVEN_268530-1 [Araneus ventricosus]